MEPLRRLGSRAVVSSQRMGMRYPRHGDDADEGCRNGVGIEGCVDNR